MSEGYENFYSYETYPQLTNPMLLVLSDTDIEQRLMLTKRLFGELGCESMIAQLGTGVPCLSEDDNVIRISTNPSPSGSYLSMESLDRVIRQDKLHKYPHNNDLTICLFFDSSSSNIPLIEICTELYNTLTNAYYNRVVIDIYFLLLEDFVESDPIRLQNILAARKLGSIEAQEWIRYIFLLSDVNSEGQLTNDYDRLFTTVLTSAFLTNSCNGDGKSIGKLEDVLMRETETGKFFCLGHISLQQSVEDIFHMVRKELLNALSKDSESKLDLSRELFFPNILVSDVKKEVTQQSSGIRHIPYYKSGFVENTIEISNSDLLDLCFHDGPERFMDEAEIRSQKHFAEYSANYWRQLKAWMDDTLFQFSYGISANGYEDYVASEANKVLLNLEQIYHQKYDAAKEELRQWKSQSVRYTAKKRISVILSVLMEWRDLKADEVMQKLLISCISDMRTRIKYWRDDMARKYMLFSALHQDEESRWNGLIRDSDMALRLLLEYRQKEFVSYLCDNRWWINACCGRINSLLREEISKDELINMVSAEADKFVCEGLQTSLPWADTRLPEGINPRIDDLYTMLYQALKTEIPLLTRRRIYNAATYLCFFGKTSTRFTRYIYEQGEYQYILHLNDKSASPMVMFFRHLESCAAFFWKELV